MNSKMNNNVNENTPIENLGLSTAIVVDLKGYGPINTLGELLHLSTMELLSIDGLSLISILKINEVLNGYGYHLQEEEVIDTSDLHDATRLSKITQCRNLLSERNKIKGKPGFEYDEIALNYQIEKIIAEIKDLRDKAETSINKR